MITIKVIASGSSGNCYLVSGGGTDAPLLIEAGIPIKQIREALPFPLHKLAGCLVSHSHGDHAKAAAALASAGVNVFGSPETIEQLEDATSRTWMLHALQVGTPWPDKSQGVMARAYGIGQWYVTPFEVDHDVPGSLGFVIGSPDGDRLLYATDTVYLRSTFKGLTHVCVEVNHCEDILRRNTHEGVVDPDRFSRTSRTHMSLQRFLMWAEGCDRSTWREVHLLHLSNSNSSAEEFQRRVTAATGVPTVVAPERG